MTTPTTPLTAQQLTRQYNRDTRVSYLDRVIAGDFTIRSEEVAALDLDHNGTVTAAELNTARTKLSTLDIGSITNTDGTLKANAQLIDFDGNGTINDQDRNALQFLLSPRGEINTRTRVLTAAETATAAAGIINPSTGAVLTNPVAVTTRGGYTIITDVNDTRPGSLGTNHNIIIQGPDGVLSHIWGDPKASA